MRTGAVAHLEAALAHYRVAGNDDAVAAAHSFLGYVLTAHHDVMDIPRALACFSAAEAVISTGTPAFELQQARTQAALYGLRTEEGATAALRALEIAKQLGRADLVAVAQSLLASHRVSRGELAAARVLIDDAWVKATYVFRHPLIREAVHADPPAPRRQQLHLRTADALEAHGMRRPADVAAAAVHLAPPAGSSTARARPSQPAGR